MRLRVSSLADEGELGAEHGAHDASASGSASGATLVKGLPRGVELVKDSDPTVNSTQILPNNQDQTSTHLAAMYHNL